MARRLLGPPRSPAVLVVLALLLATAGWLAFRAFQVRSALLSARAELVVAGSSTGDPVEALRTARARASDDVRRARSATQDPLWRLAGNVPLVGRSFAAAGEASVVAQRVVDRVLPPLVDGAGRLQSTGLLADGRVDVDALVALRRNVTTARQEAVLARRASRAMGAGWLPGPLASLQADLLRQVTAVERGLGTAERALGVAPAVLGDDATRRYLLVVQNNAEVRGTGGLVGAYAVLRADGGRLSVERLGTNSDLRTAPGPVVDLGPEFSARYDRDFARRYWSAAVLTPDWPSAARIMSGLWQAQGGGQVHGVLGVDPVAMAEILAVTGPAVVGGREIGAGNVVDFVMRDEYALWSDDTVRKQALAGLAQGLYGRVAGGRYSAAGMLAALGRAGGTGHLQVWFADPAEQDLVRGTRASGSLGGTPGDYLHVVSNNAAGNKADYYVRRKVTYARTSAHRAVVTVQLSNTVDASSVPPIVVGRLDQPTEPVERGATRQLLSVYVGQGQQVRRVLVDGVEAAADLGTEGGHGVATVLVEIRPSRPTEVTAEVTSAGGRLLYRQQPLVVDDELDLQVPAVVG